MYSGLAKCGTYGTREMGSLFQLGTRRLSALPEVALLVPNGTQTVGTCQGVTVCAFLLLEERERALPLRTTCESPKCCCCIISRNLVLSYELLWILHFLLCFNITINTMASLPILWNKTGALEIGTLSCHLYPIWAGEQGMVPSTFPTENYRSEKDLSPETLVRDCCQRDKIEESRIHFGK